MSLDFRQLGVLEQQKWPKTSFFAVNSVFSERACELKVKFISPPGRGVIDRAEFDCHFFQACQFDLAGDSGQFSSGLAGASTAPTAGPLPERHGRRPSPWAAKKREKKNFLEVS